jgi:hypothetical protein
VRDVSMATIARNASTSAWVSSSVSESSRIVHRARS